jgi:CRP-like cAMP-binding protein
MRRLLAAARLWEVDRPGGVLPITQDELAGLAGTTRPTVNRVLAEAADAGLVVLHRGRIELLDPATLAVRAAGR